MKRQNSGFKKILSAAAALLILIGNLSLFTVSANKAEVDSHNIVSVSGKKILVIGNSMLFYGNCVNSGNQGGKDKGYLYRLIRAGGEKATVVDHTYPGKSLSYIYENYISKLSAKQLGEYDFVVMSEWAKENKDFIKDCKSIMSLFKNSTEFYYMCHPMLYEYGLTSITDSLSQLRELGVEIVDWGRMVYNIYTAAETVEGSALKYNRETFIKNNVGYINGDGYIGAGSKGDDKHPNPLSGYIAAQMLYSAITHRPAEYQDYSFCGDSSLHKYFDFDSFISAHYNGEKSTNFDKVFASAADMYGLQKVIDKYNELEGRHSYVVLNGVAPTCVSSGITDGIYCIACGEEFVSQSLIPRLGGHTPKIDKAVAPTCVSSGKTEGMHCTLCGETLTKQQRIDALGHKVKTTVTPATAQKAGKILRTCRVCKKTLSTEKIYRIKSLVLSKTSYTYNGAKRTPKVTVKDFLGNTLKKGTDYTVKYSEGRIKSGTYTVTVTFKGNYSGASTLKFKIKPKPTALSEITSSKAKLTVKWKRQSAGNLGYQLQYSTNRSFKNAKSKIISKNSTLSTNLSGLKSNKGYYLRIRTFRDIKGVRYYSAWSDKLYKKTK